MSERFLRTFIVKSSTSDLIPPKAELEFYRQGSRPVHVRFRLSGAHQWSSLGLCAEPGGDKLCFSASWGYSEVALGEPKDPDREREVHFGFWEAPDYSDGGVDPVGAWVAESQGPVGGPRQDA